MSRKLIPVEEATEAWNEDPAYRAAYDTLGGEFALVSAVIKAPDDAGRVAPRQPAGDKAPRTAMPATVNPRLRRS